MDIKRNGNSVIVILKSDEFELYDIHPEAIMRRDTNIVDSLNKVIKDALLQLDDDFADGTIHAECQIGSDEIVLHLSRLNEELSDIGNFLKRLLSGANPFEEDEEDEEEYEKNTFKGLNPFEKVHNSDISSDEVKADSSTQSINMLISFDSFSEIISMNKYFISLNIKNSSIIKQGKSLFLCIYLEENRKNNISVLLTEFCKEGITESSRISYILEHSEIIIKENAIDLIANI